MKRNWSRPRKRWHVSEHPLSPAASTVCEYSLGLTEADQKKPLDWLSGAKLIGNKTISTPGRSQLFTELNFEDFLQSRSSQWVILSGVKYFHPEFILFYCLSKVSTGSQHRICNSCSSKPSLFSRLNNYSKGRTVH